MAKRIKRDVLTGETLPPGRFPVFRAQSTGTAAPQTLHRHTMATDDSFAWTKAFLAYIGELYPVAFVDAEWAAWREWWKQEYVMDRLIVRFGAECVALAVKAAQMVGPGTRQEEKARRRVMRAVRSRDGYLPHAHRPLAGRDVYHGLD